MRKTSSYLIVSIDVASEDKIGQIVTKDTIREGWGKFGLPAQEGSWVISLSRWRPTGGDSAKACCAVLCDPSIRETRKALINVLFDLPATSVASETDKGAYCVEKAGITTHF